MGSWAPCICESHFFCILLICGSNITYYNLWGTHMISLNMHTINLTILERQITVHKHGKTWHITPTEMCNCSAFFCDWINYLCICFLQKIHDGKTTTSLMLPQFLLHHLFLYFHTNPQVSFIYQSVVLCCITCSVLHCFSSLSLYLILNMFCFNYKNCFFTNNF
jgi:hypothetical protein